MWLHKVKEIEKKIWRSHGHGGIFLLVVSHSDCRYKQCNTCHFALHIKRRCRRGSVVNKEGNLYRTLTHSLPCFSVQIKHKIDKNMNSVQQQYEQHH